MKKIKDDLMRLCSACAVGSITVAADIAAEMLSQYSEVKRSDKNLTVTAFLKGKSDYTLMLDAHIDEVAFIVTSIDDSGFLTVAKCGGIDLRILPASRVIIHGKRDINGVFCSTPPHLSSEEREYKNIAEFKIDSCLGSAAKQLISAGDYVTYDCTPFELLGSRIAGKSLDDRAGVVCLVELARRLSGKELPFNVVLTAADSEELGNRGSTTAAYEIAPDEAIAIDVSFASAPDVSQDEAGVLGGGAMIGFSPVLNNNIGKKLISIARENNISYQTEVMGGRTSTDSDVIAVSGKGVKTGLISIPLRNMHTPAETADLKDVLSVCDILESYILSGGVMND